MGVLTIGADQCHKRIHSQWVMRCLISIYFFLRSSPSLSSGICNVCNVIYWASHSPFRDFPLCGQSAWSARTGCMSSLSRSFFLLHCKSNLEKNVFGILASSYQCRRLYIGIEKNINSYVLGYYPPFFSLFILTSCCPA